LVDVLAPRHGLLHGGAAGRVLGKEARLGNHLVEDLHDLAAAVDPAAVDLESRHGAAFEAPQPHRSPVEHRDLVDAPVLDALALERQLCGEHGIGGGDCVQRGAHLGNPNRASQAAAESGR
jgi:hypothetical protein